MRIDCNPFPPRAIAWDRGITTHVRPCLELQELKLVAVHALPSHPVLKLRPPACAIRQLLLTGPPSYADKAAASARPFLCISLISMAQIKAPARAISSCS